MICHLVHAFPLLLFHNVKFSIQLLAATHWDSDRKYKKKNNDDNGAEVQHLECLLKGKPTSSRFCLQTMIVLFLFETRCTPAHSIVLDRDGIQIFKQDHGLGKLVAQLDDLCCLYLDFLFDHPYISQIQSTENYSLVPC